MTFLFEYVLHFRVNELKVLLQPRAVLKVLKEDKSSHSIYTVFELQSLYNFFLY